MNYYPKYEPYCEGKWRCDEPAYTCLVPFTCAREIGSNSGNILVSGRLLCDWPLRFSRLYNPKRDNSLLQKNKGRPFFSDDFATRFSCSSKTSMLILFTKNLWKQPIESNLLLTA
ncbi:hypothetical protein RF11_08639 [Thelohanellus kitauei]|uniref:Uncharacterized protein n=1 Tax=Thelohanellus kitauei TaxID=669202 RepID=A0A0C2N7C3_THEKT|nr:hypothetical protein RF11_08639 [Thelohanellus kitauei]